jgi:hypothetical protein
MSPGQLQLPVSVAILDDTTPEDTESFTAGLKNPLGGAELGLNKEVRVNILSNDDGHGVIQFAEVCEIT